MNGRLAAGALVAALLAAQTTGARAATLLFATEAGTDSLYSVDPATGTTTLIGPVGAAFQGINGIAFAPDGTLYGVDVGTDQLMTIDTATGAATPVGPLGSPAVKGLTFSGSTLYGTDRFTEQLVVIDIGTGAATNIGPLGFGAVFGLAADADGNLFGTDASDDVFLSVDPVTGAASVIGSHRPNPTTFTNLFNLTFAPDGTLFATDLETGRLVTVDPATGALTDVGPLGQDLNLFFQALAAAPEGFEVIPLPAAGWLLLAGIGALAVLRRRGRPA